VQGDLNHVRSKYGRSGGCAPSTEWRRRERNWQRLFSKIDAAYGREAGRAVVAAPTLLRAEQQDRAKMILSSECRYARRSWMKLSQLLSSPSASTLTLTLSELSDRARSVLSELAVAIQDTDGYRTC
jgi:hypothetical protein